jgi:hypothetical protein
MGHTDGMRPPSKVMQMILTVAVAWTAGSGGRAIANDEVLFAVFHFAVSVSLLWVLIQSNRQEKPESDSTEHPRH